MNKQWFLCLLFITACMPVCSQTVIYEDNFDNYAEAQIPDHWHKSTAQSHSGFDPAIEIAIWGAVNYEGWTTFGDGYDTERLQHADDPKSFHSGAYWKNAPGADFSAEGSGNRVFTADSVIPAGGEVDSWVISDPFDVSGFDYAVFSFESYFIANQDQELSLFYRFDESGPWQRELLINDMNYRDDQRWYGPYAFTYDVQNKQSIQFRFHMQASWSWFWTMDKFRLVGYNDEPPVPAKPEALHPNGNVGFENLTLQSSAYSGDGEHVFSQWQIRQANGTYGEMLHETWDPDEIAWVESDPILDTAIQPTVYSEEEDSFIQYDLEGDQTTFTVRRGVLRPGMNYYWRVRHWNESGEASPWSDETQFSVTDLDGFDLLSEDFDDTLLGEAPDGWILENIDVLGDGDFGAMDVTRPRHRWADLLHDSHAEVWADGSGRHGGFEGNVVWVAAWAHDVNDTIFRTLPLDFSNATSGWLIFDSNFKGSGTAFIDIIIDDGEPINIHTFEAFAEGDGVRQSVETVLIPPDVAEQSNVRIQFRVEKTAQSWTFDNLRVIGSSDATFVEQPIVTEPTDTIPYTPGFITINASDFNDPDGESHASSIWQVARADIGLVNPFFEETITEGDLTSLSLNNLLPGHNYLARVKYITDSGRESPWSLTHSFTVEAPEGGDLLLAEGFDNQEGQEVPEGWFQNIFNTDGGYDEFNGWSFLTLEFFESYQQGRTGSPYFTGRIADADSDEYQNGDSGAFNSELLTPVLDPGGQPVLLAFDQLYQHWPTQIAEVNYSLDGGDTFTNLLRWDSSVYGESERNQEPVILRIEAAANTSELQIMWKLYGTEGDTGDLAFNDWWWAIDNVRIYSDPSAEPSAPDQPTTVSPSGSITYGEPIELLASTFNDPSGAGHAQSQWQLARTNVGFDRPILDEISTSGDLDTILIEDELAPNHDYIWRVKYESTNGIASEWSEPETFTLEGPVESTLLLDEDFNDQSVQNNPAGWSQINNNDPGGFDEFNGWSFLTLEFFESYGQGRAGSPYLEGIVAVADSDEYEQSGVGAFNSALISPALDTSGMSAMVVFDQIYQQYSDQIGEMNYSLDNGESWINIFQWTGDEYANDTRFADPMIIEIPEAADTSELKLMWKLYGTSGSDGTKAPNQWFWVIDNVKVYAIPGDVAVDEWMIH